jgi:hypothetical protein
LYIFCCYRNNGEMFNMKINAEYARGRGEERIGER